MASKKSSDEKLEDERIKLLYGAEKALKFENYEQVIQYFRDIIKISDQLGDINFKDEFSKKLEILEKSVVKASPGELIEKIKITRPRSPSPFKLPAQEKPFKPIEKIVETKTPSPIKLPTHEETPSPVELPSKTMQSKPIKERLEVPVKTSTKIKTPSPIKSPSQKRPSRPFKEVVETKPEIPIKLPTQSRTSSPINLLSKPIITKPVKPQSKTPIEKKSTSPTKLLTEVKEPMILDLQNVNQPQTPIEFSLDKLASIEKELLQIRSKISTGEAELPNKASKVQKPSEFIKIKKEHKYSGGAVRFKVLVKNISDTVITDINVTLIPSSQFELSEKVKLIGVLKPEESVKVDFKLMATSFGKSKVFGTISFIDPWGNPHASTIEPTEISIKESEPTSKLGGKSEVISQKILNSDEISKKLIKLNDLCYKSQKVGQILFLMEDIKIKTVQSIPDLTIIERMKHWIKKLKMNFKEDIPIPDRLGIDLQFEIIRWLISINNIAHNNLETYCQAFPEQDLEMVSHLFSIIDEKSRVIKDLQENYIENILQYLIIIEKISGITMYEYNFTPSENEFDLLGGMLTAIQNFGMEISQQDTSMTKLAYKNFEIILEEKKKARAALILRGSPTEQVLKNLKTFIEKFEARYEKVLENWNHDVLAFTSADELVKELFF